MPEALHMYRLTHMHTFCHGLPLADQLFAPKWEVSPHIMTLERLFVPTLWVMEINTHTHTTQF